MEFLLALSGLIASFFFAGAEAAYTAFNKIRLDIWARQKKRFIQSALFFQKKPEDFFSTILIGNNFANILYTTFATVFIINYVNETTSWLLITGIVLFFGEIFPKTLFRSLADKIILQVLMVVRLIYIILKPVIFVLNAFINFFLKILHITHKPVMDYFSKDEFQVFLHAGLAQDEKQKFISNVIQFKDVKVREAMIPRTELVAVEEPSSWDEAYQGLMNSGLPFILFYKESLDQITRAAFAYEFLEVQDNLNDIGLPLEVVPEMKSCAKLMKEFQQNNITIAMVVDEYGGTAGVVTMDDLIDEVFGEVESEGQIKALNQHTWLLDGSVELDIISEFLELRLDNIQNETIAGFVLEKTGSIPNEGAFIEFPDFRIEIIRASHKRIKQVKLIKNM